MKWIASALFTTLSVVMFSQAILPASWNFDVAAPTGWSESLGASNTRYANGLSGQACRLDATADFVLLQFAEEPGSLTYNLKGQNSGGAWQGTFTIEESADGASYTPLRTLDGSALPATAFTLFTDQPAATTRYIRWYFTNKVSGHNVALDEISLAMPTASAAQEINQTDGANNIPSGFVYSMGNAASLDITIQNLGLTNALTISSMDISGVNAGDFSLSNIPTSIAANGSAVATLNFNPSASGSRFCTITILSDDASEASYTMDIYAISGDLATEPTAQAASVSFSNIKAWDVQTAVAASIPASEHYLVLRRKGAAVSETPTDGQSYPRGTWIGNAQVVHNGDAVSFDARGIEAGSTYHYAVFSYNGPAGFENYLSTPLTNSVNIPAASIGSFYSSVDHTSPNFISQLNAVMNPANYFQVYYSNYISTLVDNFFVRDTVVNGVSRNMVECQYSGTPFIYEAGFQWTSLSREHHFPQSWMPTYFDGGFDQSNEYSDLHNLSPVLQNEVNAVRSNYPYGEVEVPTSTYLQCSLGNNSIGQKVYEMRDSYKGNAARGIMYQAAKYTVSGIDFSLPEQISLIVPYGQNEYTLKQWHFQDLPDSWEITRNEYVQYEQHNRNPFVDSIQYPCYIRFANMTKFVPQVTTSGSTLTCIDPALSYQWYLNGTPISGATSNALDWTEGGSYTVAIQQFEQCPVMTSTAVVTGIQNIQSAQFDLSVFPNPGNGDNIHLQVTTDRAFNAAIRIMDAAGRTISNHNQMMNAGLNRVELDSNLSSGIYLIEVNTGNSANTIRYTVK
ncbi:MAG: endonuclease [Flavobacteriales bacterium]